MNRQTYQGSLLPLLKCAATVGLAALLGWTSSASAQTRQVPDAQVEASVLKALAGAPELANQAITTTTAFGVVTLSGSVENDALRTKAETVASRAAGVKKVVDELTLGAPGSNSQPLPESGGSSVADAQGTNPNLQSDGTMAQAQPPAAQGSPESDNTQPAPNYAPNQSPSPITNQANGPYYGPGAPEYRRPYRGQLPPPPPGYAQGPNGQQQPYTRPDFGPSQPGYPQPSYNGPPQQSGGQQAGETVTVASGAQIRIRINRSLDSGRSQPGTTFDGIVVNDVVADGAVAIPRGATVQGVVVDATKSGSLSGRGDLSLHLTHVTLGGKVYPIVSDLWAHHGGDKTIETINKTAIGGGIGALLGAAAGGGQGAAIGAGIGGALGLGSSAASGNGQVYVPAEGMLTFHLAQPATVATVSQAEMDRLAQGVGPAGPPQQLRRRYYPAPYYGPVYYRPYYAYPYYPYPR